MHLKLFSVCALICSAYGIITGRAEPCAAAIIEGARSSVDLLIGIGGLLCFWSGISRILQGSRFFSAVSSLFSPLTKLILGKDYSDRTARSEAAMLLCANLLGLSNAATPIALSLMKRLDSGTENPRASAVSVALTSCAPPALIPTTVLSILYANGTEDPQRIVPLVWLCSSLSFAAALIIAALYGMRRRNDE